MQPIAGAAADKKETECPMGTSEKPTTEAQRAQRDRKKQRKPLCSLCLCGESCCYSEVPIADIDVRIAG